MIEEVWKDIPNFDGYEVSSLGRVRSKKRNNSIILSPSLSHTNGYLGVTLSKDDINYRKYIHQLVLLAFTGPCPDGLEVCHKDNNKFNNSTDNLKYDTHQWNMSQKRGMKYKK